MRYIAPLYFLIALSAQAQTKVAVLDTGLDLADPRFSAVLCPSGHKDFTGRGLRDTNGHGTHVAGLIKANAGNADYCLLILKSYAFGIPASVSVANTAAAFRYAIEQGATIVNYSGGGGDFSEPEYLALRGASNVLFVVAAGNEKQSIDVPTQEYYPASYAMANVIPVGNLNPDGTRCLSSNWGKRVEHWEMGTGVVSTLPGGHWGPMTGTSMATAIATGKLVAHRLVKRQPVAPLCTEHSCPWTPSPRFR